MQTRTLLVLIAMLTIVSVGSAQYEDWNITGAGARAEGLGGAFIGLADDATAISWNPSGLGQLERTEFSAVGRWMQQDFKETSSESSGDLYSLTQSQFTYNFASIAFPLHAGKINIVPAVAFQKQLDEYARFSNDYLTYESEGAANTITPGIGIKLHPMFYIGGAVNIWLGNIKNKYAYKSSYAGTNYNFSSSFDAKFSGLNFTAGLLVDFEGMKRPIPIKFGASLRTPFELTYEGDYLNVSTGDPDEKGKFSNTIEMPLMFGFGASGRLLENLTISADFEMRLYGDKRVFYSRNGSGVDTSDMSPSKSDQKQVRVGAEYLIVTSAGIIPIRAGFRTVPTLLSDYNNGKYTDPVSGTGFTVGTGFISQAFAFDVAYSRSTYEAGTRYDYEGTLSTYTDKYTLQIVSASVIVYF